MRTSRLLAMAFITTPLLIRSFTPTKQVCPARPALRPAFFRMSSKTPANAATDAPAVGKVPRGKHPKTMSEKDWRSVLSPQEYDIIRDKGTEYPGIGVYDGFYPTEGHFVCAACANPLYSADSKFKSGCGWPAFDKCYKGSIAIKKDNTLGMSRVEIMCASCDGHLGHVFEGERMTNTNERHCVNSVSVKYVKGEAVVKEEAKVL